MLSDGAAAGCPESGVLGGSPPEELYCAVCSIQCNSAGQWLEHMSGQKHRKRTAGPAAAPPPEVIFPGLPMESSVSYGPSPDAVALLRAYHRPPAEVADAIVRAAHLLHRHNGGYQIDRLGDPTSQQAEYRRWAVWQLCRHLCSRNSNTDLCDAKGSTVSPVSSKSFGLVHPAPPHVIATADRMFAALSHAVDTGYRHGHRRPAWAEEAAGRLSRLRWCTVHPGRFAGTAAASTSPPGG